MVYEGSALSRLHGCGLGRTGKIQSIQGITFRDDFDAGVDGKLSLDLRQKAFSRYGYDR